MTLRKGSWKERDERAPSALAREAEQVTHRRALMPPEWDWELSWQEVTWQGAPGKGHSQGLDDISVPIGRDSTECQECECETGAPALMLSPSGDIGLLSLLSHQSSSPLAALPTAVSEHPLSPQGPEDAQGLGVGVSTPIGDPPGPCAMFELLSRLAGKYFLKTPLGR